MTDEEIDDATLLQFLSTANWDSLLQDTDIKAFASEIKNRVEAAGELDIAAAHRIKLVVVGDGAVGKTSLLISYATDQFPTDYVPTVFENYTAQMKLNDDTILLHLWDTAGQEDYDRLRPLSYPGADLILLCYSSVHKPSLESIRKKWAPEVRHHVPNVPHFLIGTKLDLKEELEKNPSPNFELVSAEEGEAMRQEVNALKFFQISAKTRKNLDQLFQEAVQTVLQLNHTKLGSTEGTTPTETASAPAVASSSSSSSSHSSSSGGAPATTMKKEKCVLQ